MTPFSGPGWKPNLGNKFGNDRVGRLFEIKTTPERFFEVQSPLAYPRTPPPRVSKIRVSLATRNVAFFNFKFWITELMLGGWAEFC